MSTRPATFPWSLLGLALTCAAAVIGVGAWLHMRALAAWYGPICGPGAAGLPHCAACYVSVALLAAGLACLAVPLSQVKGSPAKRVLY